MFYKKIEELTWPRSAFLEHLEAQILKIFAICASHGAALLSSMYVPVCRKKLWIRHFQQINRIVQVTFSYFKLNTKWTYCGLRVRNKYVKVMKVTFYEGHVLSFRVRHNKIPGRIGSTSFRERKRERERVYRLISKNNAVLCSSLGESRNINK